MIFKKINSYAFFPLSEYCHHTLYYDCARIAQSAGTIEYTDCTSAEG